MRGPSVIALLLVMTVPIVVGGILTVTSRDTSRPWFMMLMASALGIPLLVVSCVVLLMLGREVAEPLLHPTLALVAIGLVGGLVSSAVYWKALS